jgi:hypothetical protein
LLEEEGWVSDGADMLCPSCAVAPGLPFALGQPLLLCDGREVRYSGGDNHGSIFAFDRHGQKVIISKEHLVKATAA